MGPRRWFWFCGALLLIESALPGCAAPGWFGAPAAGAAAGPAGVAPLPIPAPQPSPTVSAVAADTSQKLAASQDQVKELLARVHQLESMMVEKDQQLLSMSAEMGAAHEEVAHARQEMHHWREELAELRTKLGNAEKENLTTLQTMVSSLESALATDKKENAAKAQEPMQMPIKGP